MEFVDLETARAARGLRLVVLAQTPSPWSESAKGLFHVKGIDFVAVRCGLRDADVKAWTGVHNAPVAMFDDEPPRSHWSDILALAERLGGSVPLVPEDPEQRVTMLGLSHEILGEGGLVWSGRLVLLDVSLASEGKRGFPVPVARHLAAKYGYAPERVPGARARVLELLAGLRDRLRRSRERGSPYLVGDRLTALDIHAATALAPMAPMPQELCPMPDALRTMFESASSELADAIPPELLDHRELVYRQHLQLPLAV